MLNPMTCLRGWYHSRGGLIGSPSSSTNQVSTAKNIRTVILSVRILWFYSKGRSYDLSWISTPLDLIQDTLSCLGIHRILAGSSGYMVSRLRDNIGMRLPQVITSSIHRLLSWGYKIVSFHGIRVPRSDLICCLLLCSIIRTSQDMEIMLNPINRVDHPVL